LHLFGVNWVGFTEQNGRKLLLSVGFFLAVAVIRILVRSASRIVLQGQTPRAIQARFWAHQTINLCSALLVVLGLGSIWFNDPARLATALGLDGFDAAGIVVASAALRIDGPLPVEFGRRPKST